VKLLYSKICHPQTDRKTWSFEPIIMQPNLNIAEKELDGVGGMPFL
jgi:hypothetical protein